MKNEIYSAILNGASDTNASVQLLVGTRVNERGTERGLYATLPLSFKDKDTGKKIPVTATTFEQVAALLVNVPNVSWRLPAQDGNVIQGESVVMKLRFRPVMTGERAAVLICWAQHIAYPENLKIPLTDHLKALGIENPILPNVPNVPNKEKDTLADAIGAERGGIQTGNKGKKETVGAK